MSRIQSPNAIQKSKWGALLVGGVLSLGVAGCGGTSEDMSTSESAEFATLAAEPSPSQEVLAEGADPVADGNARAAQLGFPCSSQLPVVRSEHFVTVAPNTQLHVLERRSPLTTLRHRAILLLTPTLVTTALYDAQVDGHPEYNVLDRLARAGYDAFAVDYEGYGTSSQPEDGRVVTKERILPQIGQVVEWIRARRHVAQVDLFGASLGADLAFQLGTDASPIPRQHVGKVVMAASVYKSVTPLFQEVFFNDSLHSLLSSLPYLQTGMEQYGLILNAVDDAVLPWAAATLPGVYASGPTLEGFQLPSYPAAEGHAPVLLFWGSADLITPYEDAALFAEEYGGKVDFVTLDGGSHAPFLEPVKDLFWHEMLSFLGRGRPWAGPWGNSTWSGDHFAGPSRHERAGKTLSEPVAW